jgi:hypothetical protein
MSFLTVGVFLSSFVSVFLKGFQLKNVEGNHYLLVVITSYLIAACDVLLIGLVVQHGWSAVIPIGTGGAIGMLLSIMTHKKYVKKNARSG